MKKTGIIYDSKKPFLIISCLLFFFQHIQAQKIVLDKSLFPSAVYGQSSDIAFPFNLDSCFADNNTFKLYLSDASGDFTNEVQIGWYVGWFTSFVNGTIPSTTVPGNNYRLRIKTTNPVTISDTSDYFSITNASGTAVVKAKTTPINTNRILKTDYAFGWCKSPITTQPAFELFDNCTAGSTVKGYLRNLVSNSIDSSIMYNNGQTSFPLERNYYTYVVKATKNGITSTKAYYIINSPNRLQLATEGEQQGCIPDTMQFQVGINPNDGGIGENFPGLKYSVNWGDGVTDIFNHFRLLDTNGIIRHSYLVTSCTQASKTYNVTISAILPWSAPLGCEYPQVTSKARIYKKPIAKFVFPDSACVGTSVKFTNASDPGQAAFGSTCTINANYFWYVDGIAVKQYMNVAITNAHLNYSFTTTGKHIIRLVVDNGSCAVSEVIDTICIDTKPLPLIKLNGVDSVSSCVPFSFIPTNLSNQGVCKPFPYKWEVTDAVTNKVIPSFSGIYTVNDSTIHQPSYNFIVPGKYFLTLKITNSCGTISSNKLFINIIPAAKVSLPSLQNYCGATQVNFQSDSLHKVLYNSAEGNETYKWTISGGTYSFLNGTTAQSKYPIILLSQTNAYAVKVAFTNSCGTDSATQQINISTGFQSVGGKTSGSTTLCYGNNTGTVTLGNYSGKITNWQSSKNGGLSWQNITDTTATLHYSNLTATTLFRALVKNGNCNTVASDTATVTILPQLSVVHAGTDTALCNQPAYTLQADSTKQNETGLWNQLTGPSTSVIANKNNIQTLVSGLIPGTYTFEWKVSNSLCSNTDTVAVTIYPSINNTIDTATLIACNSGNVLINGNTPTGGNGSYQFEWWMSYDNINWNKINGANSISYSFLADTAAWFKRVVIAGNCSDTSFIKKINVYEHIVNNTISGNQNICMNAIPALFTGSVPQGGDSGAYIYTWESSTDSINWTPVTAATGKDYQSGKLTVSIWFRRKVGTQLCAAIPADVSNAIKININPLPQASFTANTYQGCSPLTVQFANQSLYGTSYQWIFDDGTILNTTRDTSVKHTFNTNIQDTFTVKLITTNNCGSDTATKQIIIIKQQAYFTVSDSIGNCLPFKIAFSNQTTPSVLTTWNFGDGATATGDSFNHVYTAYGTYTVVMTTKHPGGCTYEYSKKIVIAKPTGTWKYEHGIICNRPVKFEIIASNIDSAKIIFGDGNSIITKNAIIYYTYTKAGNFIPRAELFAGQTGNCKISLQGTDTIKVDIPVAAFSIAETKECGKTQVQFADNSSSVYGITGWKWNFGNGNSSNIQNPVTNYYSTNKWKIDLIATTPNGCKDTVSSTAFIKINNKPVIAIDADSASCQGLFVDYSAIVTSIDSVNFYNWHFSNGVNAAAKDISIKYALSGNYSAKLIAGTINGCYDTITHTISILPKPTVTTSNDETLCKGNSIQLTANGANHYTWNPVTSLSCTTCPNPKTSPAITTTYVVTGYAANGCYDKDTVKITVAEPFKIAVSKNDSICIGQSAIVSASGAAHYEWSAPVAFTTLSPAAIKSAPPVTTKFRVVGSDGIGCFTDTAYVTVNVSEQLIINLGNDRTLPSGTQLTMQPAVINGPVKEWKWNSTLGSVIEPTANPAVMVKTDACYTVNATSVFGCKATDTLCVKAFCESGQVFIPNAFTPDGDGSNDYLLVRTSGIKLINSFKVFNRWGQIVFERAHYAPGNDFNNGWDGKINGKPATADVYLYVCDVECESGERYSYKGNVALLK